jgi:ubiquinone/menaquinone biosynthesis C-methylase UbiE
MNDRVFSHTQAGKLGDPARLKWLPPSDVIAALDIHCGMTVVDVGAGTGYFSIPIAEWLGTSGVVYAVDLQQEMLEFLKKKLHFGKKNLCKIELLQGNAGRVPLPDRIADLVLLANIWHELDSLGAVLKETRRLLKPGGRLAILHWRAEFSGPPGPPQEHRISDAAVSAMLLSESWGVQGNKTIGAFSYLVIATPGVEPQALQ